MTSTTDLTKKQLTTILSALDDAPRSPANKGEALRAIGRSAQRFGLTTDDVLAAAPGLLDGRMSPADFRVELHDQGGAPVPATDAPQSLAEAQGDGSAVQAPEAPVEPATAPAVGKRKHTPQAKPARTAPADKPTPPLVVRPAEREGVFGPDHEGAPFAPGCGERPLQGVQLRG
jgi:hypothetical protein